MKLINLHSWLFNLVDNFTFYKGGGGGGSTSTTSNQLDPTVAPFVKYGLEEAQGLYKSASPEYYAGKTYVEPSAATTTAPIIIGIPMLFSYLSCNIANWFNNCTI